MKISLEQPSGASNVDLVLWDFGFKAWGTPPGQTGGVYPFMGSEIFRISGRSASRAIADREPPLPGLIVAAGFRPGLQQIEHRPMLKQHLLAAERQRSLARRTIRGRPDDLDDGRFVRQ